MNKWKSIRYPGFDYSQASAYAFTVLVHERAWLLGNSEDHLFTPSPAGEIVREVWQKLPERFFTLILDAFVVMPNHIHGIVFLGAQPLPHDQNAINGETTTPTSSPAVNHEMPPQSPVVSPFKASSHQPPISHSSRRSPTYRLPAPPSRDPINPALGEIVRSLKAASTAQIRKQINPAFGWQPNYWDRFIRNEAELERYRTYLENNPARWEEDRENVKRNLWHECQ